MLRTFGEGGRGEERGIAMIEFGVISLLTQVLLLKMLPLCISNIR